VAKAKAEGEGEDEEYEEYIPLSQLYLLWQYPNGPGLSTRKVVKKAVLHPSIQIQVRI
jgi:hypothetical protein